MHTVYALAAVAPGGGGRDPGQRGPQEAHQAGEAGRPGRKVLDLGESTRAGSSISEPPRRESEVFSQKLKFFVFFNHCSEIVLFVLSNSI